MIHYQQGNIFSDTDTQVLVNPINLVGVMGAGLAREFRLRYSSYYFDSYQQALTKNHIAMGKLRLYVEEEPWVLDFPTKDHFRDPAQLSYIELGLCDFVKQYQAWGITSIAFPKLGCGLGKLAWSDVQPLMHAYLHPLSEALRIVIVE
jgi:O-acetyl-ADP-ribose deacetylase (regulator of RNase III)